MVFKRLGFKFKGSRQVQKAMNAIDRGDLSTEEQKDYLSKFNDLVSDPEITKDQNIVDNLNEAIKELQAYEPKYESKVAKPTIQPKSQPVLKNVAVNEVGAEGFIFPKQVRQPTQRGADPKFRIDGNLYYIKGDIPKNWGGNYEVASLTSRDTVFVVNAILTESLEKKIETATKPQVSLHNVDPKKTVKTEVLYTLALTGASDNPKPWVVSIPEAIIKKGYTLGDIVNNKNKYALTRADKQAADLVLAEMKSNNYTIKFGGEVKKLTTPLLEVFGDENKVEVYFQEAKQAHVVNKKSKKPKKDYASKKQKNTYTEHRVAKSKVASNTRPG